MACCTTLISHDFDRGHNSVGLSLYQMCSTTTYCVTLITQNYAIAVVYTGVLDQELILELPFN